VPLRNYPLTLHAKRSGNKGATGEDQRHLLPYGHNTKQCETRYNTCSAVLKKGENIAIGVHCTRPGSTEPHGQITNKKDHLQGIHLFATLQRRDIREGDFQSASHTTDRWVGEHRSIQQKQDAQPVQL